MARIDFGRDGLYDVPAARTDLVASANRIRLGDLEKTAPNFVLAIGPRLLDSAADSLRPLSFRAAAAEHAYLCVFADPESGVEVPATVADVRSAYRHTVEEAIAEWRQSFASTGAGYEVFTTDVPFGVPLRKAFAARQRLP